MHYVDKQSGAILFPPNPLDQVIQDNKKLKQLLNSLLLALPDEVVQQLPQEQLEVLNEPAN